MRLLVCSDFQIGAGSDYGAAPGDRLRDQEAALGRLVGQAVESGCEALLFAGDAFQHRRPSSAELMVFRRFLDACARVGLEVAGCAGNHDIAGPQLPSSLDVFCGGPGEWPRFHSSAPGLELLNDGYLCAGFLPWTHPGVLRAANAGAAEPHELAEKLRDIAAALFRGAEQSPAEKRVLVLHWALSGCELPGGLPTSALREPVLDLGDLVAQGWDWIVAGHIHKRQRPLPSVVVCGSPAVCDFGEAALPHGGWVLDLEEAVAEPFDIPGRPFVTLDLDADDTAGDVYAGTGPSELEEAVVRVRVRGRREDLDMTDFAALREAIYQAGAHKLFALEPIAEGGTRARAEEAEPDIGTLEALELWLGLQGEEVSPELAEAARRQAAKYEEAGA